jgi:hypothetical protein
MRRVAGFLASAVSGAVSLVAPWGIVKRVLRHVLDKHLNPYLESRINLDDVEVEVEAETGDCVFSLFHVALAPVPLPMAICNGTLTAVHVRVPALSKLFYRPVQLTVQGARLVATVVVGGAAASFAAHDAVVAGAADTAVDLSLSQDLNAFLGVATIADVVQGIVGRAVCTLEDVRMEVVREAGVVPPQAVAVVCMDKTTVQMRDDLVHVTCTLMDVQGCNGEGCAQLQDLRGGIMGVDVGRVSVKCNIQACTASAREYTCMNQEGGGEVDVYSDDDDLEFFPAAELPLVGVCPGDAAAAAAGAAASTAATPALFRCKVQAFALESELGTCDSDNHMFTWNGATDHFTWSCTSLTGSVAGVQSKAQDLHLSWTRLDLFSAAASSVTARLPLGTDVCVDSLRLSSLDGGSASADSLKLFVQGNCVGNATSVALSFFQGDNLSWRDVEKDQPVKVLGKYCLFFFRCVFLLRVDDRGFVCWFFRYACGQPNWRGRSHICEKMGFYFYWMHDCFLCEH